MIAPAVIEELALEFVRHGDECYRANKTSQLTACMFLALRSVSLLRGMSLLLTPSTRDSLDVLARALLESTDLLMHFRFDDEGVRTKIGYWFAATTDNAWKADHHKCEDLMRRIGQGESKLAERWSMMTTLSHPTLYAAHNSTKNLQLWITRRSAFEDGEDVLVPKIADYLTFISKLIVITTFDLPGWIPLGCDPNRLSRADQFQRNWGFSVGPIQVKHNKVTLPEGSFRSDRDKSAKRAKLKKNPPA